MTLLLPPDIKGLRMIIHVFDDNLYLIFSAVKDLSQSVFTSSKLTTETLEQGVKYVFIVNFEHISHLVLVFLLLTLNM